MSSRKTSSPPKSAPLWWEDALAHLAAADGKQRQLIQRFAATSILRRKNSAFLTLANSILGQQISVTAADAIRKRLKQQGLLSAKNLLEGRPATTQKRLRELGVSGPKAKYLLNLSQWFLQQKISAHWFRKQSRETITKELLAISGIGPWTVQMFEIFYLHERNILPKNDLGLQKATIQLYGISKERAIPFLEEQSSSVWAPYSTAAVWFLWRSLDAKDVNY